MECGDHRLVVVIAESPNDAHKAPSATVADTSHRELATAPRQGYAPGGETGMAGWIVLRAGLGLPDASNNEGALSIAPLWTSSHRVPKAAHQQTPSASSALFFRRMPRCIAARLLISDCGRGNRSLASQDRQALVVPSGPHGKGI
jgi:hypothetical protein